LRKKATTPILARGRPLNMAESIQGRAIFISYRRDDSEGEAGRLFDDLVRAYGDDSVFMDVSGIEPGLDFRKAIDANVASCGVLLAMIGPTWATVKDSAGNLRLNNADDFVRLEIASALKRGVAVIPVLVHGAKMPPLDALPDDLKDLRYRNSVEVTHARWNSDVALLTTALKNYVSVKKSQQTETVHATVPVQLPAPGDGAAKSASKSKLPLYIGLTAAVVVLAVIAIVIKMPKPSPQPQPAILDVSMGFLGQWQNVQTPEFGDNLIRLQVVMETNGTAQRFVVHAWGRCQPELCDWGTQHATLNGDELVTESWELRKTPAEITGLRNAVIRLRLQDPNLSVTVRNTWSGSAQVKPRVVESHQQFSKGFH
jgi:hypothetical protein